MRYLPLFLLLSGCGFHITSDPAVVEHKVSIDFDSIDKFCAEACRGYLGDELAYNSCKSDCTIRTAQAILEGLK